MSLILVTFALLYKIPLREEQFCFGSQLRATMARKPSVVKQLKSWCEAWYVAEATHITAEQEAEQETQKGVSTTLRGWTPPPLLPVMIQF